jgi:arylsulfatase A-like enzyme
MPRPNILIFMPDQQRADCIGCFGNSVVQTPNIDALAARGVRFENAWANHPVCGPSRVNLMTGWYPHTRGHRTLTHLLKPEEPNLLRSLKEGGYHVAWAGARGDVFAPGVTEASTHFCGFTVKPERFGMGPQFPVGSPLYDAFYHGKRDDGEWIDFDEATVRTALDWLDGRPAGPWCLWVPLMFPHLPFEVEDPWYSMYDPADMPPRIAGHGTGKPLHHAAIREKSGLDRLAESDWAEISRVYYGMTSRVDDQLGRVMAALERTGELDDTLVLYFTDHGEYLGDFGLVEKWPAGLDRCLLQNPLIAAGPGVREGGVASTFAEMVDIPATLLDLAGIADQHTHFGRSLAPALADPAATIRDRAFAEGGFTLDEASLLEPRHEGEYAKKAELQHERPEVVGRAFCLRTDAFTYVYRLYEGNELYDRKADPQECDNLLAAGAHPAEPELMASVLEWLASTSDVIPWQKDPRFPRITMGQHEPFDPVSED